MNELGELCRIIHCALIMSLVNWVVNQCHWARQPNIDPCPDVQRQNAVSAYFTSKQILYFALAEQHSGQVQGI